MASAFFQVAFGNAVKAARSQLRLSQEELAYRAGLHRTYVSDIERGTRNLSLQNIEKLAVALNVSVTELMSKADGAKRPASGFEVLLVEDDSRDAELAVRAFQTMRMTNDVRVVSDGTSALEHLFGSPDPVLPGLILLDLNLPDLNGIELLRRIKSAPNTREIPVIILTASSHDADIAACRALGAEHYLVKPVGFRALSEITPQLQLSWTLGSSGQPGSRPKRR